LTTRFLRSQPSSDSVLVLRTKPRPVGNGLMRLVGRDPFVIAVVPFNKRVVSGRGQADEARSLPGALEGPAKAWVKEVLATAAAIERVSSRPCSKRIPTV
jgi:hypothetical protein